MNLGAALARNDEVVTGAVYDEGKEVVLTGYDLTVIKPKFEDYKLRARTIHDTAMAIVVSDEATLSQAVSIGGDAKKIAKIVDDQVDEATKEAREFVNTIRALGNMITDLLVTKKNSKKEITNSGSVEQTLKDKIAAHQSKIELERREQERKSREAAAELQRKLDAEAAEANRKAAEEYRKKAEEEQRIKRERDEAAAKERGAKEAELKELAQKAEVERIGAIRLAEEESAKNAVIAPTVLAPVIPEEKKIVRTESGATSYQAKSWKGVIVNPELVPIAYCSPDQRKINEAIKAGIRTIPGVNIEEVSDVRFRS